MTYEEVTTFLAIVEKESITKAAADLYIGQGTASLRMKKLEEEIGVRLFYRQKGARKISLTPEGEAFVDIAQQWVSLLQNAEQLRHIHHFHKMKIAAPDSFNNLLFIEVYKKFMRDHPDIQLTIQTEHSTEVHQLIENQIMDFGFATNLHAFPNVIATPFFSESVICIYHKDSAFARTGDTGDLKEEDEVYCPLSSEYRLWHKNFFSEAKRVRVITGNASMLPFFLAERNSWAIVPETIGTCLIRSNTDLGSTYLSFAPPERTTYILSHRYPKVWLNEDIRDFITDVVSCCSANYRVFIHKEQIEKAFSIAV